MILAAQTLSYCSNSFTTGVESTFWEDHGFGHWRASLASSRSRGRSSWNWEGLQQVCDSTASRLGLEKMSHQMSHHFNRAIVVSSALCKLGRWLDSYVTRAQLLTKNCELPDISVSYFCLLKVNQTCLTSAPWRHRAWLQRVLFLMYNSLMPLGTVV